MGRFKYGVISVTFLSLLLWSMPLLAQENAKAGDEQKPASHKISSKAKTYDWKKIDEGIWEAHISRFPHDKNEKEKPEFAILRLSSQRYQEFQKERKEFLIKHKIFEADVKRESGYREPPPQAQDPDPTEYYVMIPHWPGSTYFATTYSGGGEPK